jgi:hypothetical protein
VPQPRLFAPSSPPTEVNHDDTLSMHRNTRDPRSQILLACSVCTVVYEGYGRLGVQRRG